MAAGTPFNVDGEDKDVVSLVKTQNVAAKVFSLNHPHCLLAR
jgi:hypothetical protein